MRVLTSIKFTISWLPCFEASQKDRKFRLSGWGKKRRSWQPLKKHEFLKVSLDAHYMICACQLVAMPTFLTC